MLLGSVTAGRLTRLAGRQVLGDGAVVASSEVTIPAWLPPPARVGLNLAVAPDLRVLRWYGRGPMESYPDRKSGARLGRFECRVEETNVAYMLPRCVA